MTASVSECFHISKFECVNLLCHFHLGVCACVLGNANHTKHSLGNNKEKLFQDECSRVSTFLFTSPTRTHTHVRTTRAHGHVCEQIHSHILA